MPSSSPKQARFMQAAAHNPQFAKKVGIKQGVAKEFATADALRKRPSTGGTTTGTAIGGGAAGGGAGGGS
jgi:hypothetical protein